MLSTPEFWVAAGFVIFVIVAAKPTMKALGTMLDDRAEGIRKQIEEAQTLREEAQAALANYQRLQRDALKEAEEIPSTRSPKPPGSGNRRKRISRPRWPAGSRSRSRRSPRPKPRRFKRCGSRRWISPSAPPPLD